MNPPQKSEDKESGFGFAAGDFGVKSPSKPAGGFGMKSPPKPWYKEPWPWFLMAGPFLAVVGFGGLAFYADHTKDPNVSEHYYEDGLKVGGLIAASKRATEMGVEARLRLTEERVEISLANTAAGYTDAPLPDALKLKLSHPSKAGMDQIADLQKVGDGHYAGTLRLPRAGLWVIDIEDAEGTWRLLGDVMLPAKGDVLLDTKLKPPIDAAADKAG